MLIEIVDTAEKIDAILPVLDEMVTEGMVTVERVQVIAYRSSQPAAPLVVPEQRCSIRASLEAGADKARPAPRRVIRMKLHANARTCPHSRRLAVERVERDGWTLATVAEAAGVGWCRPRSRKWLRRYRAEGAPGLLDRCSTPGDVARTGEERVAAVAGLRRLRMTGRRDRRGAGDALSTVSGILTRIGLGRSPAWSRSSRRTATSGSGRASSVHLDVKKLGRISGAPATASPATGAGRGTDHQARPAGSASTSRRRRHPARLRRGACRREGRHRDRLPAPRCRAFAAYGVRSSG